MKKRLFMVIAMALFYILMSAQKSCRHQIITTEVQDSIEWGCCGKKRFWQATAGVVGINVGVWAFNRYIVKEDFANISINSVKENIKHGFIWDNDKLSTNMFLHPYHGSLYFNSARSNGYNYWQSGLFAFGGSAMWELFMESEYPSTNDIIATPIGGMALGEVFYRLSDMIIDNRATGVERIGREMGLFVLSPMRGLNRIIDGDMWRQQSTSGRQYGKSRCNLSISAGMRVLDFNRWNLDKSIGFASEINVEYGDRFNSKNENPYDFFVLKVGLNVQKSQPILDQVNLMGRLFNRELIDNPKNKLNLGLYQHFDFYDSDTISEEIGTTPYKFATPASVGCGLHFQQLNVGNWDFSVEAHANGILMGGVLSDYYQLKNRNYNVASGFGTKVNINALFKCNKFSARLSHEFYRMFTWKDFDPTVVLTTLGEEKIMVLDAQGAESQASMHISELRLDYRIAKHWFITGSLQHFWRDTNYDFKGYKDVQSKSTSARLMVTYVL